MSLSRARTDSTGNSPAHQGMSPRLPRKSRHPVAYASTSKLDHSSSLQMDPYSEQGRISPITLTSSGGSGSSPATAGRHRREERGGYDRYGSLNTRQGPEHKARDKFGSLDRSAAMMRYGYRDARDRSIDRGGGVVEYGSRSSSLQRNRSVERDYPLVSLSMRSLAADNPDMAPVTAADFESDLRYQQSQSSMLILSLQTQLVDLNKDFTLAQRELEQSKSQLNSYIASVKTFWSPELKKERALRKDETEKCHKAQESLHTALHESQVLKAKLDNAEERLKLQGIRELVSPDSVQTARNKDSDRQEKEIQILQNTISEMELRIEIQKKTLSARDASIKKLVEMLQTKNIPIETILNSEAEKDNLRSELAAMERNLLTAKSAADITSTENAQLQKVICELKSELSGAQSAVDRGHRESKSLDDVQALLDIKNTRIGELEGELAELEKQITDIRNTSSEQVSEEKRHIETLHSHEKVLKSKVENLKVELTGKSTELCSLQGKLDSVQTQKAELEQQLDSSRQRLSSRDSQIELLQNELNTLTSSVEEKTRELDRRGSQFDSLKSDKIRMEADLADTRYELEVATRKLALSQKKLDDMEDQLRDKGEEILSLEARISSLTTDNSNNKTIEQLRKSLQEKTKQYDRLREQRETESADRLKETADFETAKRELTRQLELTKQSASDKENELLSLQDTYSELKSEKLKLESQLNQLERASSSKATEIESLKTTNDQLRNDCTTQTTLLTELQQKMAEHGEKDKELSDQLQKYQHEIDRLLHILKEMEHEKHNKDKQIRETQEQLKEAKQKYVVLKKNQQQQQAEKISSGSGSASNGEVQARMRRDKERIEELEEALKQSVKITTKCEMDVARQREELAKQNKLIHQYKGDVAKATEISVHYGEMESTLQERNEQIHKLLAERNRHMEEVYEMKQEAILAAISEKDSHIALLETSKAKNAKEDIERLNSDKQRLNLRLKDLVTQRMLLVVEQSSDSSRLLTSNQKSSSVSTLVATSTRL